MPILPDAAAHAVYESPAERLARRWKQLRTMGRDPASLLLGREPSFVTARRVDSLGAVPVFYFHGFEEAGLEARLRFLADNGYATITLAQLHSHLAEGSPVPERAVVLTSDDGLVSVWTCAAPLLRKYGFRATVFVVPAYVRESGTVRPTLDDLWAGRCTPADLDAATDHGPDGLMCWEELRRLERDGTIRVESHTLTHPSVAVDHVVDSILTPRYGGEFLAVPLRDEERARILDGGADLPWGAPQYPVAPLATARRWFREPDAARYACVHHVEERGGLAFFARPHWRDEILDVAHRHGATKGPFAGAPEIEDALRRELVESRDRIHEHIPGKRVDHFCYPYGGGSERGNRLVREAGYHTAFWLRSAREPTRTGESPYRICRIKHDWIFRLPGEGRRSLASVLGAKFRRFFGRESHT